MDCLRNARLHDRTSTGTGSRRSRVRHTGRRVASDPTDTFYDDDDDDDVL